MKERKASLLLGMGNTIAGNDGIGIAVARKVFERVGANGFDMIESSAAGWKLVDLLQGYERIIAIDSVMGSGCAVGECCSVAPSGNGQVPCTHSLGLHEACALLEGGQRLSVYAVEIGAAQEFSESLSPELEARVALIADQIIEEEHLHA